jgi:hypothetical protein
MSYDQPPSNIRPDEEKPARPPYPPPNEAFLVLVVALASAMITGTLLMKTGNSAAVLIEVLFIIPPVIYLKIRGYDLRRCLRLHPVPWMQVLWVMMIALALVILLDEADRLINLIFPMPQEVREALQDLFTVKSTSELILVWIGTVFTAAIAEEALFRGFMQVSMEAYRGVTKAVLFSALLFALAHFNPWWMIQILILGVFLGFISWRADSVIPCMVVHGFQNALALLTGGAIEEEKWAWFSSGNHVSPSVLIAAGALLFIGMKAFLRQTEYTFSAKPPDEAASC